MQCTQDNFINTKRIVSLNPTEEITLSTALCVTKAPGKCTVSLGRINELMIALKARTLIKVQI